MSEVHLLKIKLLRLLLLLFIGDSFMFVFVKESSQVELQFVVGVKLNLVKFESRPQTSLSPSSKSSKNTVKPRN